MFELEQDRAIGGEIHENDIRVGDIVRVGPQPKGNERKRDKAEIEGRGVEGVVIRVGKVLQVAVEREEDELEGLGGRVWV